MYRFPWYLTLVSTNQASSNPGVPCEQTVILVGSGGFLLIDNELRGSKTDATSLKMSYLALNLFNLTLKRYNIIYPSAFENLVIQTSILGSASAKHPSKHCSFRQDPMRLPLIPKSQWKCKNLFWYSTSVKKGIANQKNRLNCCFPALPRWPKSWSLWLQGLSCEQCFSKK